LRRTQFRLEAALDASPVKTITASVEGVTLCQD
jgi:hypothetical protein